MLCLTQWIHRRWPPTGTVPWIWAIPAAHTQVEAGPDTRPTPPPRPQQSLTCGYHAIDRVLSRLGFSPKLAYPLPTTDQELHQIRKLVCEILAAAAEDRKLLLQTARPTTGHASAPRRADTYTDTTQPPPIPLPSCCSPGDPHTPTIVRTPGPRDTPTRRTPLTTPHTRQPAHTRREELCAPRHAHPTQLPAHAPRTHPKRPRPTPPRPLNAAHANCFPPRTPTHTTSHIAGPRPSQAQKEKATAPRLPPPLLPTRSARRAAKSRPGPPSCLPPTYSPRTCPPSSPPWPQQKPPPTSPPASKPNPRPPPPPHPQPQPSPPPHPPTPPSPPPSSSKPQQMPKPRPHARTRRPRTGHTGTPAMHQEDPRPDIGALTPPDRGPPQPGTGPQPQTRPQTQAGAGASTHNTTNATTQTQPTPP